MTDRTPLHWSASQGDYDQLLQLLQNKADVDPVDEAGWTPLMIACSAGREDIVEKLIESGADVNWTNENGCTSLLYAASRDRLTIAELLIKSGADVNKRDKLGSTALHRAASRGHLAMVQLLLQVKGVEVNAGNECNILNPVPFVDSHFACEEERSDVCRLLVAAGASLSIQNKEKKTPVDMCKSAGFKRSLLTPEMQSS